MCDLLFSIVIPTYNYAHTLRRAVESVLRQPGENYELLVINDGSTDDTEDLLVSLHAEYDNLFRYVTRENNGPAATRNYGIDQTTGEYLVFLDADDAFCEDALSLLGDVLKSRPGLGMVVGGHISVDDRGQHTIVPPPSIPESPFASVKQYLLDKKISLSNGAIAMHRDVFKNYRYPENLRNSEDLSMFVHVLANYPVASVPGTVCYVYKHGDSLRHNVSIAKSIGLDVVDEIFNTSRLPDEIMSLKDRFAVQRLLSLSRTCYLAGDKKSCRAFFGQAFKRDCSVILNWHYSRKFFKSLL